MDITRKIHIIVDKTDSQSYHHAFVVSSEVLQDERLKNFNFQVKLYEKEDIFIPNYAKCNKEQLQHLEEKSVLNTNFLNQIGEDDIIIATGGEKVLKGFSHLLQKCFLYFGATKKLQILSKEKINFNLIALEEGSSIKDYTNVITINEFAIFYDDFLLPKIDQKHEKDYVFAVLPYLTAKRKQEIIEFEKLGVSSFNFGEFLKMVSFAKARDQKIIVISNLINEVDIETEIALKKLITTRIGVKNIKIKFVYHEYVKENKMLEVISHLSFNKNDKIILPTSKFSEIHSCIKAGILQRNILWYKNTSIEDEIFTQNYGIVDGEIVKNLEGLIFFSEGWTVSKHIANEIVTYYLSDVEGKEEELEEEEHKAEEDEKIEETATDELKEEEEPELETKKTLQSNEKLDLNFNKIEEINMYFDDTMEEKTLDKQEIKEEKDEILRIENLLNENKKEDEDFDDIDDEIEESKLSDTFKEKPEEKSEKSENTQEPKQIERER